MQDSLVKFFILLFSSIWIYYLVPKKVRWYVLLFASLVYYYLLSPHYLSVVVSAFTIFIGAILIDKLALKKCDSDDKDEKKIFKQRIKFKKRLVLFITIIVNLGLLIYFKYTNFFVSIFSSSHSSLKVALPLGISYYTLMAISYITDVYRGKIEHDKNFLKLFFYLTFFPCIIEGPIWRWADAEQVFDGQKLDFKNIRIGILLILFGLFQKMVIADRAGILVNNVFGSDTYGLVSLSAMVLYTVQIYAEFAGFILMMQGGAMLYGINLPDNFKTPFFSKNVAEFWRRWHITLGTFLKDYVFYPISLSKGLMKLNMFNSKHLPKFLAKFLVSAIPLFFVWFLNGLWHGASFKYIFYGLYYYIIMMIGLLLEPLFKKKDNKLLNCLKILRTFCLVLIGMTIFRASSIGEAFKMVLSIFKFDGNVLSYGLAINDFIIILLYVLLMIIVGVLKEKNIMVRERLTEGNPLKKYVVYYLLLMMIVIFGIYGAGYNASDFIYGQF